MVPLPAAPSAPISLIPQFFAGREVFITGATGFMGKVLVERLLYTCPEVSRLHLLMRRKKDEAPDKRLKQLKQSQVFDVIRQQCPDRLEKLSIVPGDVTKPKLGMDWESLQSLNQVSIVFHSAATLKFNELLRAAVEQNVRSVLTLMDVCDQLPNMQTLVHVSTAYSNADLSSVEEKVYPAPTNLTQLLALVDNLPEDILAEVTPKLIAPKPNTYTFTKAMAENALQERAQHASYNTAIFRPSIVISSLQDPFPGWIENLNGPSGMIVGAGKGLLHVINCSPNKRADMIPVDIVIDTLIAVAWETSIDGSRQTRVYNCCSNDNPTTWGEFKSRVLSRVREHPFDAPLWYPYGLCIENRFLMKATEWALQTAPLHSFDFLYRMFGAKQRISFVTVCQRLQAMNDVLKFFMTHDWCFRTDNVKSLMQRLAPADAAVYNLDPGTIDWEAHIGDFVRGARRFVLRERDADAPAARARLIRLFLIHRALQFLMAFVMCRLALKTAPAILRTIATRLRNMLKVLPLHSINF